MTVRTSNSAFLLVLDALPTPDIGWEVHIVSAADYETVLDIVPSWNDLTFMRQLSDLGSGSISVPKTASWLQRAVPGGGTVFDRPCMFRIYDEGVLRHAFLYESGKRPDVSEQTNTYTLTGPGIAKVLADGIVLPAGWPIGRVQTRTFTASSRMAAWVTLFNEAQARGAFPMVALTFDGAGDTGSYAWTDSETFDVSAGDNLLDLLTQWCALLGLTWYMRPDFTLCVHKSFGTARETSVVFHAGGHLIDHVTDVTFDGMATDVFAASGDAIAASTDTVAAGLYRRREVWLDAGDAGTTTAAQAYADKNLDLKNSPSMQRTYVVPFKAPLRRAFVDWDWGDTVGIDTDGTVDPTRITAIATKVDKDAITTIEVVVDKEQAPTLSTVSESTSRIRKLGGRLLASRAAKKITTEKVSTIVATAIVNALAVLPSRLVSAGTGLVGGGDLSTDRTISLDQEFVQDLVATQIVAGQYVLATYDDLAGTLTISGVPPARQTTTVTTASLADLAVESANVNLAIAWRMYSVTVDRACRVRLYTTSSKRSADAGRPPGTDPTGDHGCMLDLVFTGAGTLTLSPTVDGFVPSGVAVPYAIENTSGATSPVQVQMTWVRTE